MYTSIPTQLSCARAWVAAASAIIADHDEGYNIVIDIADPVNHDAKDNEIIDLLDGFLKLHNENPISTVSNTIFPESCYRHHGSPAFYSAYHRAFDTFGPSKGWGRYFDRMTQRVNENGQNFNPLQEIIVKLRQQENAGRRYKSAYELAIYDPLRDRKILRGGQCLSFMSFKRHPEHGLLLTAMYRNHTYISRCLGNLIGLGRLQAFVAKEVGIDVGSLTVISTHAEIDADGWGIKAARELVGKAAGIAR